MEKTVAYKLLILFALTACQSLHLVKSEDNCSHITISDNCNASVGCIWCSDQSNSSTSSQCFEDSYKCNETLCNTTVEASSECSAKQFCIECFGTAALEGVNVTEVSGCATASSACFNYSAISSVQDEEEYNISNTLCSSTLCELSTVQCDYVYYEGISAFTGVVVYEVEPASCLLIPLWTVPIILVIGLIVIGFLILVTCVFLRWLCQRLRKKPTSQYT